MLSEVALCGLWCQKCPSSFDSHVVQACACWETTVRAHVSLFNYSLLACSVSSREDNTEKNTVTLLPLPCAVLHDVLT